MYDLTLQFIGTVLHSYVGINVVLQPRHTKAEWCRNCSQKIHCPTM